MKRKSIAILLVIVMLIGTLPISLAAKGAFDSKCFGKQAEKGFC